MVKSMNSSWSKKLKDIKKLDKNTISGVVDSLEEAESIVEAYCRALKCDFIKRHLTKYNAENGENCDKSKIVWQLKDAPFDGVPFSVLSHHYLVCSYDNYSAKRVRRSSRKTKGKSELSSCPAKISIKKLKRFIDFSISKDSKDERREKINLLKEKLDKNEEVHSEIIYRVNFSTHLVHRHEFDGSRRTILPRLIDQVKVWVDSGIVSSVKLKELLEDYVQTEFQNDEVKPSPDDEAYFPTKKTIIGVVYNYRNRKKGKKLNSNKKKVNSNVTIKKKVNSNVTIKKKVNSDTTNIKKKVNSNLINKKKVKNSDTKKNKEVWPNTLEDIVQTFCSDDLEDLQDEFTSNEDSVRLEIQKKLNYLLIQTQYIKDKSVLDQMLTNLNEIESCIKLPVSSLGTNIVFVPSGLSLASDSGFVNTNTIGQLAKTEEEAKVTEEGNVDTSTKCEYIDAKDSIVYSEFVPISPDNIHPVIDRQNFLETPVIVNPGTYSTIPVYSQNNDSV